MEQLKRILGYAIFQDHASDSRSELEKMLAELDTYIRSVDQDANRNTSIQAAMRADATDLQGETRQHMNELIATLDSEAAGQHRKKAEKEPHYESTSQHG